MVTVRPKRILLWAMSFLIFLMSALGLTGCGATQEQAAVETKPGFENLAEAPVWITSIKAEDVPMYNEASIDYTNKTAKIIDQLEFDLLLFDKSGNPIVDTSSQSSNRHVITKKQLLPNGSDSGKWYIQKGALKMKARLARAVFFDGTTWDDPDTSKWIEREISKY